MQHTELAVVVNPTANRGEALRSWAAYRAEMTAQGLRLQEIVAATPHDARAMLAQLPPGMPVAVVGGDGSVRALLPELLRSGRALGLLPGGSGNDLAAGLGLPRGTAARVARLCGPLRPLDVLEVRARAEVLHSVNGLGMGFDAQVTGASLRAPSFLGGTGRYVYGALGELRQPRFRELTVTQGAVVRYQGPSLLCAAMNGRRYGGRFWIAPDADPGDGQLDVMLGARLGRPQLLDLMLRVMRGRHPGHPKVHHFTAEAVSLRWSEAVPWHIDGDLMPPADALSVRVLPGALRVLA